MARPGLVPHELTATFPLPREAHLVVVPVLLGWVRFAAAAGFAADVVLRGEGPGPKRAQRRERGLDLGDSGLENLLARRHGQAHRTAKRLSAKADSIIT